MSDISQVVDGIVKIFQIVTDSRQNTLLSVVGLLLLAATLATFYHLVRKPEVPPKSLVAVLFLGLIAGIVFSASGPLVALVWVSQHPIKPLAVADKISRLEMNEEVRWVVRFISYYPESDPDFSVGKLSRLGPEKHQFTFVAPYEDLVGVTVTDAIRMTGGTYRNGQRVSAILFPLKVQLYPASARGLLQVIQTVENNPNLEIKKAFLKGKGGLNDQEHEDLKDSSILSYRFANFRDKFKNYCDLTHRFRCDATYSARDYLGEIGADWHPLGFAQQNPDQNPCVSTASDHCKISSWAGAKAQFGRFGTRIFLIRNLELNQIPDRILMDFQDPHSRVIPELGLPSAPPRRCDHLGVTSSRSC